MGWVKGKWSTRSVGLVGKGSLSPWAPFTLLVFVACNCAVANNDPQGIAVYLSADCSLKLSCTPYYDGMGILGIQVYTPHNSNLGPDSLSFD